MTESQNVARALLAAGAVEIRPAAPFTFASGLRSPIYCDNRLLLGHVAARRSALAGFVAAATAPTTAADIIAGTATAGIPWAAWAAEALALPMCYVRGAAKGHGRGRQIEGAAVVGLRVLLLEDTISTGESALNAAAALRAEGATLAACVCIFTWGWQPTRAAFAAVDLPLITLTTLDDLLAVASADGLIDAPQRAVVSRWAADPQGWQP